MSDGDQHVALVLCIYSQSIFSNLSDLEEDKCPCDLFDINIVSYSLNIYDSVQLSVSLLSPFSYPLLHPPDCSLKGFPHPSLPSWPGKRGGSHSHRTAACRPQVPSSTSRLYITELGRRPLCRWSWWSSPSPPAPGAPRAPPVRSGTWTGIKVNENETSDQDGQMGEGGRDWNKAQRQSEKSCETNGD